MNVLPSLSPKEKESGTYLWVPTIEVRKVKCREDTVNYVLRERGITINTALFIMKDRQILIQVSVSTTEFLHQHRFTLMSLLLVTLTVCILFRQISVV